MSMQLFHQGKRRIALAENEEQIAIVENDSIFIKSNFTVLENREQVQKRL